MQKYILSTPILRKGNDWLFNYLLVFVLVAYMNFNCLFNNKVIIGKVICRHTTKVFVGKEGLTKSSFSFEKLAYVVKNIWKTLLIFIFLPTMAKNVFS